MNINQFSARATEWVFSNIIPAIAPNTWQQQIIVFSKGKELADKLFALGNALANPTNGEIDLTDFEKRVESMFAIDPVFAFPINEPALALIGISPEHTLKFSKADVGNFISYIRGYTTTTQVTL